MKKNKNKGKKALTAVGAIVAAGLTPGILAAAPATSPVQSPTAAQVVSIDGNTYDFDELYAMQQSDSRRGPVRQTQHASRYGVPSGLTQHSTYYGVPRPNPKPSPETTVKINMDERMGALQEDLWNICAQVLDADPYTNGIDFTIDSDLTREMGMSEEQLKDLKARIEERYGVEVSYRRFYLVGQLNTLRLISQYILRLKTVWEK